MQGIVMAAMLTLAVGSRTDTTFSVPSGTQLELENYAGSIEVGTWGKNAVRIEAQHGRRAVIDVSTGDGVVSVDVETTHGAPTSADFKLTVPAWMPLKLSGVYCDIVAAGSKSWIEAETVQGDVEVDGGEEHVSLQSVQGSVKLTNASGKMEVSSVNQGVTVFDVKGDLSAESVNGKIEVRDARLAAFEASTVNGTLIYEGDFQKSGRYELSTHNGSVYVAIPANADLNIEAASYSGAFEATFPIERDRESKRSKRYTARLGSGSAHLTVETFQGSILLYRPGEKVTGESASDGGEELKDKTGKAKKAGKLGKNDTEADTDADTGDEE